MEYPDIGLIVAGEFDDRTEPIPPEPGRGRPGAGLSDQGSRFVSFWLGAPDPLWYAVSRVSPDVVLEDFRIAGFRQPEPFAHAGHGPETARDEVIHLVLGWMRELGSVDRGRRPYGRFVAFDRATSWTGDRSGAPRGGACSNGAGQGSVTSSPAPNSHFAVTSA